MLVALACQRILLLVRPIVQLINAHSLLVTVISDKVRNARTPCTLT